MPTGNVIDGRKNNGGRTKLTREVLERVYLFMPAYKEAKESGNRLMIEKIEKEMTMGNSIFNANSLDAYYPAYKALVEGTKLTATHKGNQIVAFFLEMIKKDYSEEIYKKGVIHFHDYLTSGENKEKPLLEYRELGKRYAEELGLDLDFSFHGHTRKKAKSQKLRQVNEDVHPDEQLETEDPIDKDIQYLYSVEELIIRNSEERPSNTVKVDSEKERKTTHSIRKRLSEDQAAKKEKNRKKKGNRGEEIAMRIERERLEALGHPELIPCIKHIAKNKDGYGYDIESVTIDENGEIIPIYIEVKATMYSKETSFYLSQRELEQAKDKGDQYYIYRIYNMDDHSQEVDYYVIQGDVSQYYELEATSYIVHTRSFE